MLKGNLPIGEATLGQPGRNDANPLGIATNGSVVRDTIQAMEDGERGKAMSRASLEAIRTQSSQILEGIVRAYSSQVAFGEVGNSGSARASHLLPQSGRCPTGLLYGRVQSGKTAAMIVTSALAIDNGFRALVVLTSNNLKLIEQTEERFRVLAGPLVYSSLQAAAGTYAWNRDKSLIETFIGRKGVVFVCAKEDGHLNSLIDFLQLIGAADYPSLIMDDEADHATPDTQNAARARGKNVLASTTFRLVVENTDASERGRSIRETLSHNVFLQVTATPYALLLQRVSSQLRPAFTLLLEPGLGYTGGERFFAQAGEFGSVDANGQKSGLPPLVYVDDDEAGKLARESEHTPTWLARSVAAFLLGATAHRLITGLPPTSGYKYLCHQSVSQDSHRKLARLILGYVDDLAKEVSEYPDQAMSRPEIVWALNELTKTIVPMVAAEAIADELARHLPRRSMIIANSEQGSQLKFDSRYNFLVGGNILGRGLTIDDLLVTYYMREARIAQMDTMHQHARMYGYRETIMPFTRVFLSLSLAKRFRHIHEQEQALRNSLRNDPDDTAISVEVAADLRATRSNILDLSSISVFKPAEQIYSRTPLHTSKELGDSFREVETVLRKAFKGAVRYSEYLPVSLAIIKEIVALVPTREKDQDWDTKALLRALDQTADRYHSKAYLYVRTFFTRERTYLETGVVSGDEQGDARRLDAPVLFMFQGKKGKPWSADMWYPTLQFPSNMPMVMITRGE